MLGCNVEGTDECKYLVGKGLTTVRVANVVEQGRILILQLHRRNIVVPAKTYSISMSETVFGAGVWVGCTSSIVRTGQYSKSSSRSKDFAAS